MKCTKCGEKWDAPDGKSHSFCPSCGSKIAARTETGVADNTKAALCYISAGLGADALLGSKVVSYFSDITRGQLPTEKKLIKILADEGALECLKEAIGKTESEQAVAIKRAVTRLPFAKAEGEEMLFDFASALGWKIAKPQSVLQNLQPKQPNQKPAGALPDIITAREGLSKKPAVGSIQKIADIDWRVLSVENNQALLISEKILEKRCYNKEYEEITWENCTLRKYLNGEFLNKLGSIKSAIADTRNSNPKNPWYGTPGGNVTMDKVFLLSLDEVCRYFGDSTAELRNVRKDDLYFTDKNSPNRIAEDSNGTASWWWLRLPGIESYIAARVDAVGDVDMDGDIVSAGGGGVRPALRLNL